MNIIICGAGEVGRHSAEVLAAAGHNITLIDIDPDRLRAVEDTMDVRTLCGNGASAEILREADAEKADVFIGATSADEINIMAASVAAGLGVDRTIARVHHATYFEQRGFDYQTYLSIDRLICPVFSTSLAIAGVLRNPGAIAIENFGRGKIEMQEFPVSPKASAIGKSLAELCLPGGTRLAIVRRGKQVMLPEAQTVIKEKDVVVLVGNSDRFQQVRRLFHANGSARRKIVLMGGPPMAVWLCRALHEASFAIRLFEANRERASELAAKLDWVTVINANPTDRAVFDEERIDQCDAFIAMTDEDEHNILGCAWAKRAGVEQTIAVVQSSNYLHLLGQVGIDHPFSPRIVAARELEDLLDDSPIHLMASLAEGGIDVFRVRVSRKSSICGKSLKEIQLSPNWVIAGRQRGKEVGVPDAESTIEAGDILLAVGHHGNEAHLRKLFR